MLNNKNNNNPRRHFLSQASLGLLAFASVPKWLNAMQDMPKVPPHKASLNFKPDVEIDLICRLNQVAILPGQTTRVKQYSGVLTQGPKNTLMALPGSYLGPIINLYKGQRVRINLHNRLELGEPTVTHWHGLHVPADMDGHPQYAIKPMETLVYEFEVVNRAGLNLYHPHPHETTAQQVYQGLAGALLVHDAEEEALDLPSGEYELPLVIQDRRFDAQNQLVYGAHGMHERMVGFYGDRILVNGRVDCQVNVATRAYRLRIANVSNARIYKLGWDDGTPLTVIGVDGGLLEQPETKPYVMLAPAERLDVWVDFSGRALGTQVMLRSLAFTGALPMMAQRGMGGMHQQNALPMGSDYPILTMKITQKVTDSPRLPSQLSKIARYHRDDTANPTTPVPIAISEGHMSMVLNGRPYAHNDFQSFEHIKVNTLQLLEIFHEHGMAGHSGGMGGMGGRMRGGMMGGMMAMAHPIHLHGQAFQILSRSIADNVAANYATVSEGFINSGLKDTVLVMPGETIKIIKPFQDYKGTFMYHCHNLEHEDMGMMREFLVE
ncbi:MAG: multicopper oxidase family protein [Methylococcaceae bacterium]|nr:MAG: multicopper oxidase family protein [Methylococcaceae bacterium]